MFAAGAGQIGDYSHCSWSVTGTGQFLPHDGASPAIGTVGTVEQVAEDRVEVVAPAPASRPRCSPPCGPRIRTRSPRSTSSPLAQLPAEVGHRPHRRRCRRRNRCALRLPGARALPATSWGVRAAGDPDAMVSRVAVCGGAGDSLLGAVGSAGVQAYVTADLRHHPADEHRRASDVALVDVAHWASEYPWCGQAAALLRNHVRRVAAGPRQRRPHRSMECRWRSSHES